MFGIFTSSQTFYLQADTAADGEDWIDGIKRACALVQHKEEDELSHLTIQTRNVLPKSPSTAPTLGRQNSITGVGSPLDIHEHGMSFHSGGYFSGDLGLATSVSSNASDQSPISAAMGIGFSPPKQHGSHIGRAMYRPFSMDSQPSQLSTSQSESPQMPSRNNFDAPVSTSVGSTVDNGGTALLHWQAQQLKNKGLSQVNDSATSSQENLNRAFQERTVLQGYLLRLQGRPKQWRRRWVVLRYSHLAIYKNEQEYEARNVVRVENIVDAFDIDPLSRTKFFCFQVVTNQKSYRFCAETEEEVNKWLAAFKSVIQRARAQNAAAPVPVSTASQT